MLETGHGQKSVQSKRVGNFPAKTHQKEPRIALLIPVKTDSKTKSSGKLEFLHVARSI